MKAFRVNFSIRRKTEYLWQTADAKENGYILVFSEETPEPDACKDLVLYQKRYYHIAPNELEITSIDEEDPFHISVKDLSVGQLMQLLNLGGKDE